MTPLLSKITSWIKRHKGITIIITVVLAFIAWRVIKAKNTISGQTTYVLGTVEKGTVVASVSGSGQVSASNQVDIKSKASGDLTYLNATVGQQVGQGALLGKIDSGDAAYELETAKLQYDQQTATSDTDVRDARDKVDQATSDLKDAYLNAHTVLATASTNMTNVLNDLETLEGSGYLGTNNQRTATNTERSYISRASDSWYSSNKIVNDFMKQYRTLSTDSSSDDVLNMLTLANKAARAVAESAKYAKDAVVYIRNQEDVADTQADDAYTSVTDEVSTANTTVTDTQNTINTIADDERSLKNATQDLQNMQNGTTEIDLRSKEIALRQKQEAYDNYFIRAPFTGIIASVTGKQGETLSNGDTVATIITKQKIAEISLNEIDAAKVKVGQKATITFDAIDGLTITGTVAEADLVGTVSQGVVSYNIKIAFDTDDDRIKPGMTANANIIIGTSQDVLTVAASAIKTQGDTSYIAVPSEAATVSGNTPVPLASAPKEVPVVTGLANDDSVEIVSGLSEGDIYVERSTTTGGAKATSAAPSLFGGGVRTGGGNVRMITK